MGHCFAYTTPIMLLVSVLLLIGGGQFGFARKAYSKASCIESERQALLQFKQSLTDESNRLSSWTSNDCCAWEGVHCSNTTGHVLKLDLHNPVLYDPGKFLIDRALIADFLRSCLGGQLNPSLVALKFLRYLDLSNNFFEGEEIPTFLELLKDLRYLNLSNTGLVGKIPGRLGNLSSLKYLDLTENDLVTENFGWVSGLTSLRVLFISSLTVRNHQDWFAAVNMLPSLTSLALEDCQLTLIPQEVSLVNLTSLTVLDLSYNQFNSPIPVWFSNFTGLQYLQLKDDNLTSPSHDPFQQMTSLVYLDLSGNAISALSLKSLCNTSNLSYLDLSDNQLTGSIPSSLGLLTKLQELRIDGNSLSGVLSEVHFANLGELRVLSLSGNYLLSLNISSPSWIPPFQLHVIRIDSIKTGPRFPTWLRTQKLVEELIMSNASIADSIPKWFRSLCYNMTTLYLSNNDITGYPIEFKAINGQDPRFILLDSNKFQGPLKSFPADIIYLNLEKNLLTGKIPIPDGNIPSFSTTLLALNDNAFTGWIPEELCKLKKLAGLNLSNNKLTGRVPLCLGNLRNLEILALANNSLYGRIPGSLYSLDQLVFLRLNGNKFVGELLPLLYNMTNLVIIDVGENGLNDTLPEWMGEKFTYLKFLRIESNNFHGAIPLSLCQVSGLQVISLAKNNLSGSIPRCMNKFSVLANSSGRAESFKGVIGPASLSTNFKGREMDLALNIRYLKSIDLSKNNFVGEIPDELMDLAGLNNLDLSKNQLTGRIPNNIGNLTNLESLDLSMNQFFGEIPPSLSALHFLEYLNLSYNDLSGTIPSGTQLQTFGPSSYEGNIGLCGKPLMNSWLPINKRWAYP